MRDLPDGFATAIVTDPPYGLEFMGKEWDKFGGGRTSKPGIGERSIEWVNSRGWNEWRCANCGHLPHGGSPCACDKPDMRRDMSRWTMYQEQMRVVFAECLRVLRPGGHALIFGGTRTYHRLACAVEDAGFEIRDCLMWLYGQGFPKSKNLDGSWSGYGTALKPAWEPILLARKSLVGTVEVNCREHGTGVLNIDGCRIGAGHENGRGRDGEASAGRRYINRGATDFTMTPGPRGGDPAGRWPANIILDEEAAARLDEQSGELKSGTAVGGLHRRTPKAKNTYSDYPEREKEGDVCYGDSGGASRFFYCAKASKRDRGEGNTHPTVKPVELIRWLVRLVKGPGENLILDPFAGSGTTGVAAMLEGVSFILIEREAQYIQISERRLAECAP